MQSTGRGPQAGDAGIDRHAAGNEEHCGASACGCSTERNLLHRGIGDIADTGCVGETRQRKMSASRRA
jgi:hypothetical protein